MMRRPVLPAVLLCTLLAAPAAQAGLFDDNEARRQIADLKTQSEQRFDTQAKGQLELATQIMGLREELARLHGQIDPALQRKALVRDPDGGRPPDHHLTDSLPRLPPVGAVHVLLALRQSPLVEALQILSWKHRQRRRPEGKGTGHSDRRFL